VDLYDFAERQLFIIKTGFVPLCRFFESAHVKFELEVNFYTFAAKFDSII